MQAPTKNGSADGPAADSVVAHLRRPESWPEPPGRIEVVETHFAWVFLGERYAYKLKKPVRFHQVDLSTLAQRRQSCELEVKLNRRLAEATYLAVVPLCRVDGGFALEGDSSAPVEWLVKMRRLPRRLTLERLARERAESPPALDAVVDKLAAFYAAAEHASWGGGAYARHLAEQQREWAAAIAAASGSATPPSLERLVAAQALALGRHAAVLADRVGAGRVVDAHGDLRPEHVFVLDDPQIIDCLEFSRELRLLDSAEELAFLDLECARIGRPDLGRDLVGRYRARAGDSIDEALFGFYRSRRALARALISTWNLCDAEEPEPTQLWRDRRDWYLAAGLASLAAGPEPLPAS